MSNSFPFKIVLSLKIISLFLAVIFLIAGTAVIASAEGEDNPAPGGDEPISGGGSDEPISGGGSDEPVSGGGSNYSDYEDDPIFFGDASNYDYNTGGSNTEAGPVSEQTTLFSPSTVNQSEVAPTKWNPISLDEKEVTTGVADFKSIKQNTTNENAAKWIYYLGFVLIGLACLGIIYFIVATAAASSAKKRAAAMASRRTADPAPPRSVAGRMEERERRAEVEDN